MADETWESRAIPIMEAIAAEEHVQGWTTFNALAGSTGLAATDVEVEIRRLLEAEFIAGEIRTHLTSDRGQWKIMEPALLERGSRAIGQWPSSDPYDALLELLDRRLLDESLDDDTRTRLQRFRSTLVDVGKGAAGGVLAALIRAGIGL